MKYAQITSACECQAKLFADLDEKRYVLRVLDAVDGRRGQAAKILGLDRKTLYRKLERWGLGAGAD